MTHVPRVLVLGAGIAGLTAAYELARRGLSVKVLEAAPFAGGRTSSFRDARGRSVDTGLHVVADHYLNLIEILAELGVSKRLRWVDKHTYLRAGRPPMHWYFSQSRPPFHLLRPFREMPLGVSGRLSLAATGLLLSTYEQADLAHLDDVSYLQWHHRQRLGDGFALELAEAAADAATFLTVREAAARPVLSWLKYLLRHRRAGDVGLFCGSLEECLIAPLRAAIEQCGCEVRTQSVVTGLDIEGQKVTAVRTARSAATGPCVSKDGRVATDGAVEYWSADYVISALPVQALAPAFGKQTLLAAGLGDVLRLETTPAISALIWFDRRIEPPPSGAPLVTGCAMRDFVDLATLGRRPSDAPGSVYQFVITRADQRMTDPDEVIAADVVRDLGKVWPGARNAKMVDYAIERIGAAMFAAHPGAHRLRPTTRTALSNLSIAGDFVRHELNASMEGAALSGRLAANSVLSALGAPTITIRKAPDQTVVPMLRHIAEPLRRAQSGFRS
jgi:zeta-carotene desaturase